MDRLKLLLVMPYSGPVMMRVAKVFWASPCNCADVVRVANPCTLLARNFNMLWATALNLYEKGEVTHFAMMHDDVEPPMEWLDVMFDEMQRVGADVISAVVPIKDDRGLTSTAIDDPLTNWEPAKRLTATEIMQLPETFSAADTEFPERALLVNSGCWLADMRCPAFHETKIGSDGLEESVAHFAICDRVVRREGMWAADAESEDWLFSKILFNLGVKVFATRKILVLHHGEISWRNDVAWGALKEDDRGSIAKLRRMAETYEKANAGGE